jgi:hypothetical protein
MYLVYSLLRRLTQSVTNTVLPRAAIIAVVTLLQNVIVGEFCFAVDERIKPFLTKYCYECHSGGVAEGGLDLDTLAIESRDADLLEASQFAKWEQIFDRVESKEMPPKATDQPSDTDRETFNKLVGNRLWDVHSKSKGTVYRRLNRREYTNTLNDLFGTNLNLKQALPEDGRSNEFDNVGESLNISMVQLEKYIESIERVMNASIATTTEKPTSEVRRASYANMKESKTFIGKQWYLRDDGAVVFYKQFGYPTGMLRETNTKVSGRYKVRVTGYAYQSETPITFSVGSTSFERGAERPTFGFYSMPPGDPTTVEIDLWLERNYMIEVLPWGLSDPKYLIKNNGVENYKGPGLAISHIELEGPIIDEFPLPGHTLLFAGIKRREIEPKKSADKLRKSYKPKFEVVSESPHSDASTALHRIARIAFRREVSEKETKIYSDLFKQTMEQGESFEVALRTAVAAIFCSPDFLFLREQPGKLNDYALASRLAFFLTRNAPDELLLDKVKSGQLTSDPEALENETKRLFADPRSERFIIDFTDAWLNLRDIDFTSPDQNLFPEFDPYLQFSMVAETRSFVRRLFEANLGIENLIQSDFAMLNERLAAHYEIAGVAGPEIRSVMLPKNSVRGGLLSQASVLKVSANGTNTSPVVRGIWVTERIFGKNPPPPPPGIPGVEPDIRGSTTLRELLEKHRDSDNCRACHAMIDPPGFALENFNPIGGWSDRFRSLGDGEKVNIEIDGRKVRYKIGPKVDATGQLADGRKFESFNDFRSLLITQKGLLAKSFVTKLLTFATGREMGFSDRTEIESIVKKSSVDGYRVGDLLKLSVASKIFQTK